jgi:stage V sporulation protein G
MKITSVNFYGEERGNFIRYSAIVVDGAIVIRDLKLIRRSDNTIMIAMPSKKLINESHEETVHPTNSASRKIIEEAVLGAWAKFPRVTIEK